MVLKINSLQNLYKKENEGKTSKEELIRMATGTNKLAAVEGDVVNGMMQAGQSFDCFTKSRTCSYNH